MAVAGGAVAGPVGLWWLQALNSSILPGASGVALTGKFVLDQVLGCLIWQASLISIDREYRDAAEQFVFRKKASKKCCSQSKALQKQ